MVRSVPWWAYLAVAVVAWGLFHGGAVRRIREWIQGVPGEQEAEELLTHLESHDYRLLRDIKVRGGTVAGVAIGPTGVFAIETKTWWPLYAVLRHRLLNGSWEKDHQVHELRRAGGELRDRLRAVGIERSVETLLVLTRVALPSGPVRLESLVMIDTTTLLPYVLTRGERLSPNQITMAAEAIRGGIPVAAASTTSSHSRSEMPSRDKAGARPHGAVQEPTSSEERIHRKRRARSPKQPQRPPAPV